MKKVCLFIVFNCSFMIILSAQPDRWQQRVNYKMNVSIDVNANLINGTENLEYSNNSPDKLNRVFFHLYWNAFQPGSEMDVRSQELGKILINGKPDWDSRVRAVSYTHLTLPT